MPGVIPTCLMPMASMAAPESGVDAVLAIAPRMTILTWLSFLVVAWILYRTTWKPILNALEAREGRIRKALEDAAAAEKKAEELRLRNEAAVKEANEAARRMVDEARRLADDSAKAIQERTRQQADQMIEEARREIETAVAKAQAGLSRETAGLALLLAERFLETNLDTGRNREWIEKQLSDRRVG